MHDEISLIDAADRAALGRAYAEWTEAEPTPTRPLWPWLVGGLVACGLIGWAASGAV